MMLDARGDQDRSQCRRSRAIGRGRGRSQPPAKACVAGADHSGDGGGLRHGRDHAPRRRLETLRVALASALYARGGGRPVARQDAQARDTAAAVEPIVAWSSSPLAAPPGETTHWTGRAMAEARGISLRSVQRIWAATVCSHTGCDASNCRRSRVCRQAARRGRTLSRPAGA